MNIQTTTYDHTKKADWWNSFLCAHIQEQYIKLHRSYGYTTFSHKHCPIHFLCSRQVGYSYFSFIVFGKLLMIKLSLGISLFLKFTLEKPSNVDCRRVIVYSHSSFTSSLSG